MKNLRNQIVVLGLIAFTLSSLGCQHAMQEDQGSAPAGQQQLDYHRPRNPYFLPKPSLAMDSPDMNRLAKAHGEMPGYRLLAWYDMRNDGRASVESGYQSRTFETIYTQTYDRQYQHGGHIHDHYSQTTRRGSISETIR